MAIYILVIAMISVSVILLIKSVYDAVAHRRMVTLWFGAAFSVPLGLAWIVYVVTNQVWPGWLIRLDGPVSPDEAIALSRNAIELCEVTFVTVGVFLLGGVSSK